ncbi:MAG: hypothetical protein ACJ8LG_05745 [Massilia sp.]
MATESGNVDSSRERHAGDDLAVDRRVTILETRFDTMLPLLATKADLAELKGELLSKLAETKSDLKADNARLATWVATMFITMLLGFAGMFVTLLRH